MMEKLLVLDDEILILKSLERLFEDDYEVFATSDAETALRVVREHDIAVILCDERMPGTSGHEFLRRAREVSSATRFMMSGYADITALTEAVNQRTDFFLHSQALGSAKAEGASGRGRGSLQAGPGGGARTRAIARAHGEQSRPDFF